MLISEALSEFLTYHQAKGSRPRTMLWYEKTVTYLLRDYLERDIAELTVFLINKVLSKQVKPNTLSNYDRALRGFCNWLYDCELLQKNPFSKRKRVKDEFKPKQVLTTAEITKLLEVAKGDKRTRYRNQAILLLFLDTGLRSSELARIKLHDIDWDNAQVRIEGKTGNSVLPLSKKVYKALRLYVTQERKGLNPHLFLYDNKPLNHLSLSRFMNRLGKRAGIKRPVGVHILRHTFATTYLRNGGDAFTLQRIMRHSTPLMTQRYLHFVTEDLQEKLEQFSPLSKML